MPEVNGMKFPYTEKGKKDAKMAALGKKKKSSGKKQNWSGVKSQVYGG
jgi:hypothetical protein